LEGRGCVGVYLDDMFSGVEIVGNVFDRVTRAAFVGGGRDVTIDNNIFVDCKPAVHVDARAMTWASYHVDTTMRERLEAMPYREPLWAQRYPRLTQILDRMPAAPRGNAVTRNICVGGRFDEVDLKALPFVRFDKNLVDKDPRFVDRAGKNFQLEANSPAFKLGFKPIPFEKIGLYVDAYRRQIAGR